jgi:hypothetical protein
MSINYVYVYVCMFVCVVCSSGAEHPEQASAEHGPDTRRDAQTQVRPQGE